MVSHREYSTLRRYEMISEDAQADQTWEEDFASPSCVADFVWPDGVELRGNINLVDQKIIDREEVDAEWKRISSKLLQKLV
jgi:hypothetical protein